MDERIQKYEEKMKKTLGSLDRWNTGACLCNIGRNKDGLRPEASTSARASGG